MTDLLSDVETPSDAELISRVRGGDVAVYGELFSRHKDAAGRLARQLVRGPDSDDLVSEAFAKVLSVLQGGGGPDVAFRAYLLTAVRRLHVDRVRSGQRLQTTDDMTPFDPGVPFQDTAVAGFESGAAAKAFASLPERWQLVLWHLEVEGQKPADIAPLLGMSANSVSALAYRAREGLRQAFLTMHISDLTDTECRWVNEHLGAYIRKGLSKRDAGKVQAHLDDCRRCTAMYLELTEVNSNLAGIIAPLLLGAAASGYVASSGAGAAGVLGLVSRAKEFVGANTGAVTAASVAAGIAAAAAAVAVVLGGGGDDAKPVVADPPAAVTTPAAPSASPPVTVGKPQSETAGPSAGATASAASAAPSARLALPPTVPGAGAVPDFTNEVPTSGDVPAGAGPTDPGSSGTQDAPGTDSSPVSSVDLSGTTIDNNGVHFAALGSPSLPPVLTVRLTSDPSGVVFTQAGNDCSVAGDGLSAVCSTVSGGAGARTPGAARLVASSSYTAELPFDQTVGPDSADVSVSIATLPDGYRLADAAGSLPSHRYQRPAQVRQVDASLALDAGRVRPASGEQYTVGGTLAVTGASAATLGTVTYTVTGGSFLDGTAPTQTLTRPVDANPSFVVVPDNHRSPAVAIRVGVPAPYTDTTPGNNGAPANLTPYDVKLTGLTAATPNADNQGDQQFTAAVDDDGFPSPAQLTFALGAGSTDVLTSAERIGNTVTLTVRSTSTAPHALTVVASLPSGFTNASNGNLAQASWTPAPPPSPKDVDVSMLLTATNVRPGLDDVYTLHPLVSRTGPGAGGLTELTYTVTGGTFAGGDCATGRECTRPFTGTPTFLVTPDDPSAVSTVRITAGVPAGFHETNVDDNTASATLQRFDASLTGLTVNTGTADSDGDQTFTATLDADGFPTLDDLTYTLSSPEVGDEILSSVRNDGTVTLVIRSSSTVAHEVSVAVNLPPGYTDGGPGDNTAGPATWTPLPPAPTDQDVDVSMVLTSTDVRPGADDRYKLNALVTFGASGVVPPSVRYTITGGSFVPDDDCTPTACTKPATGAPSFVVTPDDPAAVSAVTITAHVPPGFHDTDRSNDTAGATLQRYDVGLSDLAAAPGTADATGNQTFTAILHDDGFTAPDDLTYTLTSPQKGDEIVSAIRKDTTVTFVVHSTSADAHAVSIAAHLPAGYTDAAAGNDTAGPATWAPNKNVDVALNGLPTTAVRPGTNDSDSVPATVSVTGPAAARVQDITYTVTGAQFVDGNATSDTVTLPATTKAPTFTLTRKGGGTATITASAPGFAETDADDNTGGVELRPYDIELGPLTPLSDSANHDGEQRFTATLKRDGFSGDIGFSLPGTPGDLTLTSSSVSGTQVTFVVHSARKDLGTAPFQIRADLPTGYTDYDIADNTAGGTYTYARTPTADAGVTSSQDMRGESGKGTVSAQVSAPSGVPVTLHVAYDPEKVTVTTPVGCSGPAGTLSCSFTGGPVPLKTFAVELVDRQGNETKTAVITFTVTVGAEFVDPTPGDNSASETVNRKQ